MPTDSKGPVHYANLTNAAIKNKECGLCKRPDQPCIILTFNETTELVWCPECVHSMAIVLDELKQTLIKTLLIRHLADHGIRL